MDRDSILQFSSPHFSPAEPVRFHVPPGGSGLSSEDDPSSDSSEDKPPRLHIMAGARAHFPADEEDDTYGTGFPGTEDATKNGNYVGPNATRSPPSRRVTKTPTKLVADGDADENASNSHVANQIGGDIKYRECLKNHAANIGGHALDGCGEFLPGSTDPLLCSVCGCHRNFHRKEIEGVHSCNCNRNSNVILSSNSKLRGLSGPPTPGLLAISTSKDIIPLPPTDASLSPMPYPDDSDPHSGSSSRKKRYRTKFSADQKKEMLQFAEKLGWKIVREHEPLVQQFCEDVGVSRNVFKVWMHNNKNNFMKRVNVGDDDVSMQTSESPLDY